MSILLLATFHEFLLTDACSCLGRGTSPSPLFRERNEKRDVDNAILSVEMVTPRVVLTAAAVSSSISSIGKSSSTRPNLGYRCIASLFYERLTRRITQAPRRSGLVRCEGKSFGLACLNQFPMELYTPESCTFQGVTPRSEALSVELRRR